MDEPCPVWSDRKKINYMAQLSLLHSNSYRPMQIFSAKKVVRILHVRTQAHFFNLKLDADNLGKTESSNKDDKSTACYSRYMQHFTWLNQRYDGELKARVMRCQPSAWIWISLTFVSRHDSKYDGSQRGIPAQAIEDSDESSAKYLFELV